MRILTNKYNLPDTLAKACAVDTHRVMGDLSCTTLIDAPQIRILKRLHNYEEDVIDNMYALMGTALHHILERANIVEERKRAFMLTADFIMTQAKNSKETHPDQSEKLTKLGDYLFKLIPFFFPEVESKYIFEKTLMIEIDGMKISGTFDLYDKTTGILYDYKFCSVYNYIFPEARDKWKQQLNIYAYMLEQHGYKVNGIRVVAFFRDYNVHNFMRNKDYPTQQVMEIPIDMRELPEIESFIRKRVHLHMQAEAGMMPPCSGKERWAKADQFAVKVKEGKKVSKRAKALFDSQDEANGYVLEHRHKFEDMFVEFRPGESVRCEKFCPVSSICPQRKKELEDREKQIQEI
jgi:hypothetical protein